MEADKPLAGGERVPAMPPQPLPVEENAGSGNLDLTSFAALLLRALRDMATRSPRRQADLTAALSGAALSADPPRVRAALRMLQAQGCVAKLVPLSDGGLLLTVAREVMEQAGPVMQWLPLDELGAAVSDDVPYAID